MNESNIVNKSINKESVINITSAAKSVALRLLANSNNKNLKLRIYVDGSCCSGLEYCFAFDEQSDDDILIKDEQDPQLAIIVDPLSIKYLFNATLDYQNHPTESGFMIINQNIKTRCGCEGSSCC